MAAINAYRMDGLGNDFIIIDRRKNYIELSKDKIIELGNRANIGFDQIIFIEKKEENSYPITIYNSDGGEVSACGNGARCVAYLLSEDLSTKKIQIKTNNRLLNAKIVGDFQVELEMGKPLFGFEEIPLSNKIDPRNVILNINNQKFSEGFCVNVGNPHIIFFSKDYLKHDLKVIGPKIENHNLFPEKINVTFADVIDKKNIRVNVWERGAGLTKACGTAACATAVASFSKNRTERKVQIAFDQGSLKVEYNNDNNIFMTGPVSKINEINISKE